MTKAERLFNQCFEMSEQPMTIEDALALLGLAQTDIGDQNKIKKAWREASLLAHPDRGGSHEKQLLVNSAYARLKKTKVEVDNTERKTKFDADLQNLRKIMRDQLKEAFDFELYVDYFKEQSGGMKFNYQILNEWPNEKERGYGNHAGFDVKFFTSDKKISFEVNVGADALNVIRTASLGSGTLSYDVFVETHGFFANKKQKLHKRDWNFTSDHAFLTNPAKLFPKAKLKKIFSGETSKRAFKKRDMLLFMKERLNAKDDNDYQRIPVGKSDDPKKQMYLVMYRSVFMRLPTWNANGLYVGPFRRHAMLKVMTFKETESFALHLLSIQEKVKNISDPDKMTNELNKLLPKHEDNIGYNK